VFVCSQINVIYNSNGLNVLLEHRPDALHDTVITMRNDDDDDDDGEEEKLTSCSIHCVMTYVSAVLLSSLSNNSYCHVTSVERHSVGVVFHRVCLSVRHTRQ